MNKDDTLQAIVDETGVCSPSAVKALRLAYEAGEKNKLNSIKRLLMGNISSLDDYGEHLVSLLSDNSKMTSRSLREYYNNQMMISATQLEITNTILEDL